MKWLAAMLATLTLASASELASERIWTGTNGKTFRGVFLRLVEDGTKAEIASTGGQLFRIDLANLSEPDRRLIDGTSGESPPSKPTEPGDPEAFRPVPAMNRELISFVPSTDSGVKWTNLATCSAGSFIMWWGRSEWIPVPRRGKPDRQAIWIDRELKRYTNPRSTTVPRTNEMMKALAEYFEDNLADTATYRIRLEPDLRPENFVKWTRAGDACLVYASAGGYGVWMPLIDATPNGTLKLACFDKPIEAQWEAGEPTGNRLGGYRFEIPVAGGEPLAWTFAKHFGESGEDKIEGLTESVLHIRNRSDLPNWLKDEEIVFKMRPRDPMVVFRPYVYAEPGTPSPVPADPDFDPATE